MQEWCGNRLAKGFVRPGRNQFPSTPELAERLKEVFDAFEPDFDEMSDEISKLPSVLSRLERTGVVSMEDILKIGAVGMAARMGGLNRDIRASHAYGIYPELQHTPIIKHHGDVYSRVQIRKQEVKQSMKYLRQLMVNIPKQIAPDTRLENPKPDAFTLSLVEGWRGEICHCAITDAKGELILYKIKDPSFHNWLALALAVRNNEISDFPVCNKSFNLSYCGHDL
jgi:Ni,Fe-hydrogenase III large subunit